MALLNITIVELTIIGIPIIHIEGFIGLYIAALMLSPTIPLLIKVMLEVEVIISPIYTVGNGLGIPYIIIYIEVYVDGFMLIIEEFMV